MSVLGYQHVGRLVLLDAYDNLLIEPSWAEFALNHWIPAGRVKSHLLSSYRAAIECFAEKSYADGSWKPFSWLESAREASI